MSRNRTYRSTHPSRYYERQRDERGEQLIHWDNPTWSERNGELIVAVLGLAVILFALGAIAWAVMAAVL